MRSTEADVEVDVVTQQVQLMPWREATNLEWFLRNADVRLGGRNTLRDSVLLKVTGDVEVLVQRRGLGIPVIRVDARDTSARIQLINPVRPETISVDGVVVEVRELAGPAPGRDELILAFRSGATIGTPAGQPVLGSFAHYLVKGRVYVRPRSIFSGDAFVASSVDLGPGDFVSTDPRLLPGNESVSFQPEASTADASGAIVIGNEPGLRVRALFTSRAVHVWRVDGKRITESPRVFATVLGDPVLRFLAGALGLVAIFFPLIPSSDQRAARVIQHSGEGTRSTSSADGI
ncbi:MAG: hypothetical protein IT353_04620 [Gemmatimonadaceae bacterium]|nr:hypothetical protein [Gemmatimonadaceae bacterium]